MFTIEANSEAGRHLAAVLADPHTYKVSIEPRTNGVAIKQNEHMWSPTLAA
jgi:hypothetical protein